MANFLMVPVVLEYLFGEDEEEGLPNVEKGLLNCNLACLFTQFLSSMTRDK